MASSVEKKVIIAILGPTASGKSSVALEIAKEFNATLINCDSRQIYKEMIIGTASPTQKEKSLVKHRLFNFLSPRIQFNASDYAKLAVEEIKKSWENKTLPILVGGTGFYYSAIADGLGEAGSNPDIAISLQKELNEKGLSHMIEKLKKIDESAIDSIDTNNPRRVLRAIEIVTTTKKPFSQNKPQKLLPEAEFYPIVVTRPREILHNRIEQRINQMFEEGLEREVKHIIDLYGEDTAGLSSIGYREWLDFFKNKISINELKELILVHTRQYAKRQETWFRKNPGVPFDNLEDNNVIDSLKIKIKKIISVYFNKFNFKSIQIQKNPIN